MEKGAAIGNRLNLFQLVRSAGPRKPSEDKMVKESDGSLITLRSAGRRGGRGTFGSSLVGLERQRG